MTVLKVVGLGQSYAKKTILKSVDFSVDAGEVVCLLGASGSGKSTCLRLIAGLEKVKQGAIYLNDKLVGDPNHALDPKERQVGLMFQDFALFSHMNVEKNVGYGLRNISPSERKQKVQEILEKVQLSDYAQAMPQTLSGGQQQRAALARAMVYKPKILLLDEPFSGLDRNMREKLRDQTLHIIKESNIAAVMVTHDPEEAMFMGDKILLLNRGIIEQQGRPEDIYYTPATPHVARFFGDMNEIEGRVEQGQIQTILGPLGQCDKPEGSKVLAMIRPEGLKLCPINLLPQKREIRVIVEAARRVGRGSMVHMGLKDLSIKGAQDLHLHARIDGTFMPHMGSEFALGIDKNLVYVFESNEAHNENAA